MPFGEARWGRAWGERVGTRESDGDVRDGSGPCFSGTVDLHVPFASEYEAALVIMLRRSGVQWYY